MSDSHEKYNYWLKNDKSDSERLKDIEKLLKTINRKLDEKPTENPVEVEKPDVVKREQQLYDYITFLINYAKHPMSKKALTLVLEYLDDSGWLTE